MNRFRQIYKPLFFAINTICIVLLLSACSQSSNNQASTAPSVNDAYIGMYQSISDTTNNFFITERNNKVYARNAWVLAELKISELHRFELAQWNLIGQFGELENGKFQLYTETINGQKFQFKRISIEQSNSSYVFEKKKSLTKFSQTDALNCSDDYPLHSLAENSNKPDKIEKLIKQIESDRYSWDKQDSLLIFKDNKLLVEEYFNGWQRDEPHALHSVSKSLTSLLVGSLITEGKIANVNMPITAYLPQYQHLLAGDKSTITLANFMNMSAGIEWNEWDVPYTDPNNISKAGFVSDDSIAFTLKRPMAHKPGEYFSYSGGYVSVVGGVIDTASEQETAADYARISLLKALCFKDAYWGKQYDGRTSTAGGAIMRPIDMLKIGQLMLDDGVWQGKQLLNKQWVEDSLNANINPNNNQYGYFWWHDVSVVNGDIYTVVKAEGWGGQEIIIIKELNLVVVITASNYETRGKGREMLNRFIIPAFVE